MATSEALLTYYKNELTYLRQMGAMFATRYPKVASRLALGADECPDPQVERLLEAFAFLTARLQHDIDDALPDMASALLSVLYPQYLAPLPSLAVARFEVDPAQSKLTTGHLIRQHTPLFAQSHQGQTCRFRTCYPVTLWPVDVTYAGFEARERFACLDTATNVAMVLRLRLSCLNDTLPTLALKRLRLYLHGDPTVTHALYELLFGHVVRVVLLPDSGAPPLFLPENAIAPVGFGPEDAILPAPAQAHPGYRLLQEYFAFPAKFLFVDLDHLATQTAQQAFDVLILLDQAPRERLSIDHQTFRLGCTPIINLFRKTTEPIRLDQRQTEYRLVPDVRRERTTEIHSILSVTAASNHTAETQTVEPFYAFNHAMEGRQPTAFWHARRRPTGRPELPGTELLLTFVDLAFAPAQPPMQTLFAHTLCTNRGLAEHLEAGSRLQMEEAAPLRTIVCLQKPTPQRAPPLDGATQWRLISHLSLNYLSLADSREGLQALREILRLYSFTQDPALQQQVDGIRTLSSRQVVRRLGPDAWRGWCRGLEVTLGFDERLYVGSSAFLLAAVLRHFVALYTAVNSFTQLVITSQQREGIWKQWPPIAGVQSLL
jgi:type VI secretion system protein ImpG